MFAALILAAAVSEADACHTVPDCVTIAQRDPAHFSESLRTLLLTNRVPLGALLDGWEFQASTPAITARIHEILLQAFGWSNGKENASRAELARLLDFALSRARRGEAADDRLLVSVEIHLSLSKDADLLAACAGPDPIGLGCALWAGKAGRSEKAVADVIWAMLLDENSKDYRLIEAAAGCAPVRERFRKSMEEHLAKNESIRLRDAALLVQIDEPWSWKMLQSWVDNPDPERARAAVSVLVGGGVFDSVPDNDVRVAALWRAMRDGALHLRRAALQAFVNGRSRYRFTDAQLRELLAIASSSRDAGRLLSPVLARSAHMLTGAPEIVAKTLFSPLSESLTEDDGKGVVSLDAFDRSQSESWEAVKRTPESTCWLTAPVRTWASDEKLDLQDEHTRGLLDDAAAWVDSRWGTNLRADARSAVYGNVERNFVCGTAIVEAEHMASADAAAFGLNEPAPVRVPAPPRAAGDDDAERRASGQKLLEHSRRLREGILRTLATPPKKAARCEGFAPMSAAHREPRPRMAGTVPTLDVPVMPSSSGATVTVIAPDGAEIPATPAVRSMLGSGVILPRTIEGWWRGPGRYQLSVAGEREPKPVVREFVVGESEVACTIRTGPWADAVSVGCARRAPAAVSVKVQATREKLELTLTNRTSDTLLPPNHSWAGAWSFSSEYSGGASGSISSRDSDERALEANASRTWTYTFKGRPLAPVAWRTQATYIVGGSDAAFITDPVDFSLAPFDDGPGATRAFVAAKSASLAIRSNRVFKIGDTKPVLVVDPGVSLAALATDAEGSHVIAAGAVTLLSNDGGETFQALAVPDDSPVIAAAYADSSLLLFLEGGKVLRRDGESWKTLPSLRTTVRRVAFADAQRGFLLDTTGHAMATTDGGNTWSALELPAGEARSIAADGREVWLATAAGLYVRGADAKWTLADAQPCRDVAARGGIVSAACEVPLARFPNVPLGSRKFPELGTTWRFADVRGGRALMTGDHGTLFMGDDPFGFTLEKRPNRGRVGVPVMLVPDEPDSPPKGN